VSQLNTATNVIGALLQAAEVAQGRQAPLGGTQGYGESVGSIERAIREIRAQNLLTSVINTLTGQNIPLRNPEEAIQSSVAIKNYLMEQAGARERELEALRKSYDLAGIQATGQYNLEAARQRALAELRGKEAESALGAFGDVTTQAVQSIGRMPDYGYGNVLVEASRAI
jgi:hypothetical protein